MYEHNNQLCMLYNCFSFFPPLFLFLSGVNSFFFYFLKFIGVVATPYPPFLYPQVRYMFSVHFSFGSPQYGPIYAYICRRFKRTLLNPLHVYELNKIKPFEEFNSFFCDSPMCSIFQETTPLTSKLLHEKISLSLICSLSIAVCKINELNLTCSSVYTSMQVIDCADHSCFSSLNPTSHL